MVENPLRFNRRRQNVDVIRNLCSGVSATVAPTANRVALSRGGPHARLPDGWMRPGHILHAETKYPQSLPQVLLEIYRV